MTDTTSEPTLDGSWYKPGKSITEFHKSPALVRAIVGGRGCGKTTGLSMECISHAWHTPGGKILCVRKTDISNTDTTISTFNDTYTQLGQLYQGGSDTLTLFRTWDGGKTVRLPSAEAVRRYNEFLTTHPTKAQIKEWIDVDAERWCSTLMFRGLFLPNQSQNRLRGAELTMLCLIEADLLSKSDYGYAMPTLRAKNAFGRSIEDYSLIIDTNPPEPDHWIAKLEAETKNDPKYAWWHICTEENRHNLPPNYIEDNVIKPYSSNQAMLDRMYYGQYARAFDGTPVYHKFNKALHCQSNIPWPKGARLIVTWDFGSTHATLFSAYFSQNGQEYFYDLKEYYNEQSDVDNQCKAVTEILKEEFPFFNDRDICVGVWHYCDPAGANKTDKGSSIEVLNTYGFFPGYRTDLRSLPKTFAICNRVLETKYDDGTYMYKIDEEHCPRLTAALAGGYRYPERGEPGYGSGMPRKDPGSGGYDHLADVFRYSKTNTLKLAKMDSKLDITPHTGQTKRKGNPTRDDIIR